MKELTTLLRQARLGLGVLTGSIVASALAVWGMGSFEQSTHLEVTSSQSQEAAERTKLQERNAELVMLKANYDKFEGLRKSGLVGTADRDGWVETLVKVHQAKNLPDTLDYKLQAPVAMPGGTLSEKLAPVQTHDLTISLDKVHELELLDVLTSYSQQVSGQFRLQSCQLKTPSNAGLSATCLLRFFNQPMGPPPAAPNS